MTSEVGPFLRGGTAPDGEAFAVLAVIQRLPESYRETLVLRLVEGMTGTGDRGAHRLVPRLGAG